MTARNGQKNTAYLPVQWSHVLPQSDAIRASCRGGKSACASWTVCCRNYESVAARRVQPFAVTSDGALAGDEWGHVLQEGWHFSCERETIMERQVHFQSSDWKWTCLS